MRLNNYITAVVLLMFLLLSSCATTNTEGTLASLKDVKFEVKEEKVDGSLEKAMESYEKFLKETPETEMTPEALRRLADLKIQKEYESNDKTQELSESALTAAENVEYILRLQNIEKAERIMRVRSILDEVGLQGKYDSRPDELSGGQQQRVAVARAIVSDPAVVLADEPTANLDSKTGEKLLEMMKVMNEGRQVTFIFATHDRMVMDFAKRIVSLHDGKVAEDQKKK